MRFTFLTVVVEDMRRARNFYSRLLQQEPVTETERLVEFESGEVKMGLYDPSTDGRDPGNFPAGKNCYPCSR